MSMIAAEKQKGNGSSDPDDADNIANDTVQFGGIISETSSLPTPDSFKDQLTPLANCLQAHKIPLRIQLRIGRSGERHSRFSGSWR